MKKLRIINKTGISNDTKVMFEEETLDGVVGVHILPISTKGFVKAILEVELAAIDIKTQESDIKIIDN